MDKITLRIEGMSCGHCKAAVEKAVQGLSGVKEAEADLNQKSLTVIYDRGKTGKEDIVKAVLNEGYQITG